MILLILFIAVPIVELYFLVYLSSQIGFLYTLGIVIVTGVIGVELVKSQGKSALTQIQGQLSQGKLPATQIVEGILILVAGVLLITPGIFTDITGFLLLIPFTRRFVAFLLKKHFAHKINIVNYSEFYGESFDRDFYEQHEDFSNSDRIIEGDWEEKK